MVRGGGNGSHESLAKGRGRGIVFGAFSLLTRVFFLVRDTALIANVMVVWSCCWGC